MSTTNLITDSSIDLHNPNIVTDVTIEDISSNNRFGVLSIDFAKTEMTTVSTFILFTIDRTGSMSEVGNVGDAYNKMHYVKETFKQIVQYISRKDSEIYIKVNIFNTEVETLINTVKVTPEICDELIEKIISVEADGSTAIDAALNAASTVLQNYGKENTDHQIYHIFMTDGEPTVGVKTQTDLASMVNPDFATVFIGFGKNHNSILLRKMSEGALANYEFIDNIEHTSIVYGSIMHEILYTSIRNLRLIVENGEIYDWKTDEWTTRICEPSIISETKKLYYLRTTDRESLAVRIFGTPNGDESHLDDVFILPDLEDSETGEIYHSCDQDLSNHIYRFAVQKILYQSKSIDRRRTRQFKQLVSTLFRKMHRFMRLNNLIADPLMIQLCDDLSIIYRTIGTRHGHMLSVSRSASQGRQSSNTTSMSQSADDMETFVPVFQDVERLNSTPFQTPVLNRARRLSITPLMNSVDEEDDFEPVFLDTGDEFDYMDYIENHVPSENPISCFATPSALQTIRSLTQVEN